MDWQDEEFETFLRQFRPRTPKALPSCRRTVVTIAAAAMVLVAVVIPMRKWWEEPASNDAIPMAEPAAQVGPAGEVPREDSRGVELIAPIEGEKSRPAVSRSPTLSPVRGVQRPGAPPPDVPVSVNGGVANRRIRVGGAIKPPTRLVNVNPVYPEDAQAAGVQGIVILQIVIGQDGSVIDAQVLRSIPELDQAALDAVLQWQYEPTLLNGEPVEVEMDVTINFTLR